MRINLQHSILELLIKICTVSLFASFFIFESYSWGRFVLIGMSTVIFLLYIIYLGFKVKIRIGEWHKYVFAFGMVCLLTTISSIHPHDAISKFIFIIQILVCFTPLYSYYSEGDKTKALINAIKWAGYVVVVYSMGFYGVDFVLNMLNSAVRLENSFSNVNSIGQIASVAIIIQVYEIINLKEKNIISCIFILPALLIVLATQSRKAFVLLSLGLLMVYIISNGRNKRTVRLVIRIFVAVLLIMVMLWAMSKFSIFSGINERMGNLWNSFMGNDGGRSANIRKLLVEIGWDSFLHNPILGIGIGSPHLITLSGIGQDTYLHNNYIELLCGGGIIGFCVFYYIYVHLLKNFFRYRKVKHYGKNICVILILLFLIMEWGKVSCYSKETYFYFMLFFLEVKQLKIRGATIKS